MIAGSRAEFKGHHFCRALAIRPTVRQSVSVSERTYLHPHTGWITYYIYGEDDIRAVIELFRMNSTSPGFAVRKLIVNFFSAR
jgi:hypothetical protein